MRVEFSVPGEPVGKGRPRFVRQTGRAYTPAKTVSFENLVKMAYQAQCGETFFQVPLTLSVYIVATFQIPKTASKSKQERMEKGLIRPAKKPDCDNVLKAVCDALNGVAYHDDAQIVSAIVSKRYGPVPSTRIEISTT